MVSDEISDSHYRVVDPREVFLNRRQFGENLIRRGPIVLISDGDSNQSVYFCGKDDRFDFGGIHLTVTGVLPNGYKMSGGSCEGREKLRQVIEGVLGARLYTSHKTQGSLLKRGDFVTRGFNLV